MEELRSRYGVTPVVLLRAVGLAHAGGAAGEGEAGGGLVESLLSSDLGDDNIQLVAVIVRPDVLIDTENVGELVSQTGDQEAGGKQSFFFFELEKFSKFRGLFETDAGATGGQGAFKTAVAIANIPFSGQRIHRLY